MFVNDQPATSLKKLAAGKSPATISQVEISPGPDGRSLAVAGRGIEVIVEADSFPGWAAKVPDKNKLALTPNDSTGELELAADPGNSSPLTLRFSDGGAAEMSPNSFGHLDVFKDQSYYFSGFGKIQANSADGLAFPLSNLQPPLTGGPLVQKADDQGVNRFKRLTPQTEVRFGGAMAQEVSIEVGVGEPGAQTVRLARGQRREVTLPNGSVIEFAINDSSHNVEWHVKKGLFRFNIDGFDCWRALGLSHQSAGQQWDGGTKSVDLTNLSKAGAAPKPNQFLYATFARNVSAAVSLGAMLQYSPIELCHTYNVSAVGGTVVLYDSETRQQMALTDRNQLIKPGIAIAGTSEPVGASRAVTLAWETGSELEVKGVVGEAKVGVDSVQTVAKPDGGTLVVGYGPTGDLKLSARNGDFLFQPRALENWGVELREGDTVTLNLDTRKGVFTLHTDAGNRSVVTVTTADGYQPVMHPDATLTFILGRPGTLFTGTSGDLIFFEAAGAGGTPVNIAGTSPFGTPGGQTDVSRLPRIDQPPASVVSPGP